MAKRPPKGQTRTLAPSDTKVRFNLKEIFGVDFSNLPGVKQAIGQALIDRMVDRSQDQSRSWTGSKFPAYSKSYKKSDEFQAFGKSSKVNLTLTGDMLGTLDIVEETNNTITAGWDDSFQSEKANGHITGSVGKVRDFLAVNSAEIQQIKSDFKSQIGEAISGQRSFIQEAFEQAALQTLKGIGDSDG